jgi:molybdopterin-binding protein
MVIKICQAFFECAVLNSQIRMVTPGAVNTEVVIGIAGGSQVVSIITRTAAESRDFAVGKDVYAVAKTSNVMAAID